MKRIKIVIIASLLFLWFNHIYGGINLGMRICNNQWNNKWLITPAPEVSLSTRWFWIGADGTMGSYKPLVGRGGYIFQTRFSLIPMLRIPFIGPFFGAAGYGFSYTFRRVELENTDGKYEISSKEIGKGEIRAFLGMEIPISSKLKIYIKGGYSFINDNNRYFSASFGTSFIWPKSYSDKKLYIKPPQKERAKTLATSIKRNLLIKRVTFISSEDIITNELNTAIETALVNSGIKVFRWKTVRQNLVQYLDKQTGENNINADNISSPVDTMTSFQIAVRASRLLKLDAIIKTHIRYTYKSYGAGIIVHSAYVKIIQPQSGEIIWATEYNPSNKSFLRCKQKLSKAVLQAVQSIHH